MTKRDLLECFSIRMLKYIFSFLFVAGAELTQPENLTVGVPELGQDIRQVVFKQISLIAKKLPNYFNEKVP
jgi:hypothetical protein